MRPKKLPDSHYLEVAEVYRKAQEAVHPPLVAIAEWFGVPHSTAAGWVKRARDRGLMNAPKPICRGRCPSCCAMVQRAHLVGRSVTVSFRVFGLPQTQGSVKGYVVNGRARLTATDWILTT